MSQEMNSFVFNAKERLHKLQQWIFDPKKPLHTILPIVLCAAIVGGVIYIANSVGTFAVSEPIYRFDTGARIDYTGRTTFENDSETGDIYMKNHGDKLQIDHAPIYFTENKDKILLPAQMAVIYPEATSHGRSGFNTEIEKKGDTLIAKVRNKDVDVSKAFLFDGNNTYIFLEPVTIELGLEKIELPAYSYAYVYFNLRMELYSPDGTINVVAQTGDTSVYAISKGDKYQIDLSRDVLQTEAGEILLITDPSVLNYVTADTGKK
jgi:hypothetical protein